MVADMSPCANQQWKNDLTDATYLICRRHRENTKKTFKYTYYANKILATTHQQQEVAQYMIVRAVLRLCTLRDRTELLLQTE